MRRLSAILGAGGVTAALIAVGIHHVPSAMPLLAVPGFGTAIGHSAALPPAPPTPTAAESEAAIPAAADPTVPPSPVPEPLHTVPTSGPASVSQDRLTRPTLESAIWLLQRGELAPAQVQLEHIAAGGGAATVARARLLWAACAELRGDLPAARAAYLECAADSSVAALHDLAVLSAARVMLRAAEPEAAVEQLTPLVLQLRLTPRPADLWHLWSQAVAAEVCAGAVPADQLLAHSLCSLTPEMDLPQFVADVTAPADRAGAAYIAAPDEVTPLQFTADETRRVSVSGAWPIRTLAERLAALAAQPLEWSPVAAASVAGRRMPVEVDAVDADLLMMCVCVSQHLSLRQTAGHLYIDDERTADVGESAARRRTFARQALNQALRDAPQHRWAPLTRLQLARLEAADGDLAAAARLHELLLREFTHAGRVEVLLNLGKLRLWCGDPSAAVESLNQCVDAAESHPLQAVACLHLCCAQLQAGAPRPAVAAGQRAVLLARSTPLAAQSRTLLASALLLADDPAGASTILSHGRELLMQSELRDAAAFLDALARYRTQRDPLYRLRDATHLLDALTHLNVQQQFGAHWQRLVDEAYTELGLRCVRDAAETPAPTASRDLTASADIDLRRWQDRLSLVARPQFETVAAELDAAAEAANVPELRLLLAQTAFRRGCREAAEAQCRALLSTSQLSASLRRAALRLLGEIHQSRGEHAAALQCYIGLPAGAVSAAAAGTDPTGPVTRGAP